MRSPRERGWFPRRCYHALSQLAPVEQQQRQRSTGLGTMQEVARAVVGQRIDGGRGPPARIANTKVATNNQRYGHCHGVKAGTWSEDYAIGR